MAETAATLLLVEDQPSLQLAYRAQLTAAGIAVQVADTAADALRLFRVLRPRAVMLELALPDRDGLALLAELLAIDPGLNVVVMSAQDSVDRAVTAMRAGAFDFILKPFDDKRFVTAAQAALDAGDRDEADLAGRRPRRVAPGPGDHGASIGASAAMQKVHQVISAVASSIASVFITGESGTGKELAAYALHEQSSRAKGPFIALNCGAIPHDLLESEVFGHIKGSFTGAIADNPGAALAADGGTLFLDEICEMAPTLQTKFLRFLQNSMVQPIGATRPRKVDVRIISATNRDPMQAVRQGHFREDLFYRLHVVPLHLPPLRARGHDVIEIAEAALRRYGAEEGKMFTGFSPATESILLRQAWPGNVRQLLNVIRNVVVLHPGGQVAPDMLPPGLLDTGTEPVTAASRPIAQGGTAPVDIFAGITLADLERQAIEAALARHEGSAPRAARDLDVSLSTLYRRIGAWGLKS